MEAGPFEGTMSTICVLLCISSVIYVVLTAGRGAWHWLWRRLALREMGKVLNSATAPPDPAARPRRSIFSSPKVSMDRKPVVKPPTVSPAPEAVHCDWCSTFIHKLPWVVELKDTVDAICDTCHINYLSHELRLRMAIKQNRGDPTKYITLPPADHGKGADPSHDHDRETENTSTTAGGLPEAGLRQLAGPAPELSDHARME